jgi:hypothetical protein
LNYPAFEKAVRGKQVYIWGKDETGTWLLFAYDKGGTVPAWIMTKYVTLNGDIATLPVIPAEPLQQPELQETTISFSGSSTLKTKSFDLEGGNYTIDWTATDTNGRVGCSHGGYLKAVDPNVFMLESFGSSPGAGETKSGSTEVYNLKPGKYYFQLFSGCDWTVRISPQQ